MNKKIVSMITLAGLAGGILINPLPVFADRDRGHDRGFRDFHGGGHVVHRIPPGYVSLSIAGASLLYSAGMFYRYTPSGYIVVAPPAGVIVPTLPPGYTTVMYNGAPYYYYGYTYYAPAPTGYVVTSAPAIPEQPVMIAQSAPVIAQAPVAVQQPVMQAAPAAAPSAALPAPTALPAPVNSALYGKPAPVEKIAKQDVFEIYIPNGNGSYTSVTLRKTEKGFLGPQGEFYTDHPTIDQLKERYGKK